MMERKLSRAHNKKTGVTYVYEVLDNHWDPQLRQARNKRRLIGKIDPITNEIVPTGRKGPQKKLDSDDISKLKADYQAKFLATQTNISALEVEINSLRSAIQQFALTHQAHMDAISKQLQSEEAGLKTLLSALNQPTEEET